MEVADDSSVFFDVGAGDVEWPSCGDLHREECVFYCDSVVDVVPGWGCFVDLDDCLLSVPGSLRFFGVVLLGPWDFVGLEEGF